MQMSPGDNEFFNFEVHNASAALARALVIVRQLHTKNLFDLFA